MSYPNWLGATANETNSGSVVYWTDEEAATVNLPQNTNPVTVYTMPLSLSAGNYFIQANIILSSNPATAFGADELYQCSAWTLTGLPGANIDAELFVVPSKVVSSNQTFQGTIQGFITLPTSNTIIIRITRSNPSANKNAAISSLIVQRFV